MSDNQNANATVANYVTADSYAPANVDFKFRAKKGEDVARKPITLAVPQLTIEGIGQILEHGSDKARELLSYQVNDILVGYAKSFVDEDLEFDQDKLDQLVADGKLSFEAIANLPRSARNRLSKSDIEAFVSDYIKVMPEITGKDVEKVKVAAQIYVDQFKSVAGKNDVLAVLAEQLEVFMNGADEEMVQLHERVLTHLVDKIAELRKVEVSTDMI